MSFRAARLKSGMTPVHREKPVASGQAWEEGALLVMDANGAWTECGADPASIGAVAESAYGSDTTGFNHFGSKEFPPGYMQGILVNHNQPFHAEYVGTLPAADGGSYGVVRDSDGKWKVDFSDTTATRVKLVSRAWTVAPLNRNRVEVVFLAANVQVL